MHISVYIKHTSSILCYFRQNLTLVAVLDKSAIPMPTRMEVVPTLKIDFPMDLTTTQPNWKVPMDASSIADLITRVRTIHLA